MPYDGIVRRRQSLIQSAAAPCPEAVIRGHVNAVEAAEKGIALGSKLAREGFRIAIVGALQEMVGSRKRKPPDYDLSRAFCVGVASG